jgi:O-antigen ligase
VSDAISYGAVLVVYGVLFLFTVIYVERVAVSKFYVTLIALLAGNLVLSGILSPSIASVLRVGVFFVFTLANFIILPYVISFGDITRLVGRYAAGLMLLGFLPFLGIHSIFGVFDLSLWGGDLYLYPALSPITSIFLNPNTLGFVMLVGATAAVIETWRFRQRVPAMLLVLNSFGLLFTNYRTGMGAFVIVLCLCAVYQLFGHQTYVIAVMGGLATFTVILLMMFSLLPGPAALAELSLNGRRLLWRNAVDVIRQQPITGFGFGNYTEVVQNPHNSYLRAFLALGLGGGIVYTLVVLRTILQSVREVTNWYTIGISLYLITLFFVQMMNSLTFIGISFHSTWISLMIGYHIRNDALNMYEITTKKAGS